MAKAKSVVERFKDEIRRAERRGITRYRIAKECGISDAQLSRLMHGTVAPRLDTAERIAGAIGLSIVFAERAKTGRPNLDKR
jgi:transcriptional regulator with XRE-family HTH domain